MMIRSTHPRNAKVCAIVKGFPGYERYTYETDVEGNVTEQEKYPIVANYATVVEKFGMTPYSVWMNLSKGKTVDDIYKNLTSAQQLIDENKKLSHSADHKRYVYIKFYTFTDSVLQ